MKKISFLFALFAFAFSILAFFGVPEKMYNRDTFGGERISGNGKNGRKPGKRPGMSSGWITAGRGRTARLTKGLI